MFKQSQNRREFGKSLATGAAAWTHGTMHPAIINAILVIVTPLLQPWTAQLPKPQKGNGRARLYTLGDAENSRLSAQEWDPRP